MHRRERFDQHIDLAAAAQPNGPGQVVTDAVVKQAGRLALEDRLRLLEDFPLETAAADGTGDLARLADRHPGAGRGALPHVLMTVATATGSPASSHALTSVMTSRMNQV